VVVRAHETWMLTLRAGWTPPRAPFRGPVRARGLHRSPGTEAPRPAWANRAFLAIFRGFRHLHFPSAVVMWTREVFIKKHSRIAVRYSKMRATEAYTPVCADGHAQHTPRGGRGESAERRARDVF
jgi:hypothetical protein